MLLQHPIRRFTFIGMLGGALGGALIPALTLSVILLFDGAPSLSGWIRGAISYDTVRFIAGFGAIGAVLGTALGGLTGLLLGIAVARRGLSVGRLAWKLTVAGAVVGWIGLGLFLGAGYAAIHSFVDLAGAMVLWLNVFGALGGAIGGWVGGWWLERKLNATTDATQPLDRDSAAVHS